MQVSFCHPATQNKLACTRATQALSLLCKKKKPKKNPRKKKGKDTKTKF